MNSGTFKLCALYAAKSDLKSLCFQYPKKNFFNEDLTLIMGKPLETSYKTDMGIEYLIHLCDYYWSVEGCDRKKNPDKYKQDDPIEENYGLFDALDGEWDAYWNID